MVFVAVGWCSWLSLAALRKAHIICDFKLSVKHECYELSILCSPHPPLNKCWFVISLFVNKWARQTRVLPLEQIQTKAPKLVVIWSKKKQLWYVKACRVWTFKNVLCLQQSEWKEAAQFPDSLFPEEGRCKEIGLWAEHGGNLSVPSPRHCKTHTSDFISTLSFALLSLWDLCCYDSYKHAFITQSSVSFLLLSSQSGFASDLSADRAWLLTILCSYGSIESISVGKCTDLNFEKGRRDYLK